MSRRGKEETGRPKAKGQSVVDTAADILRTEIMRSLNGNSYLGSEESVAQDLGISKPSLRQATRLLEFEQILEVRRGIGGGLFVRKPDEEVVLRTVSLYLIARAIPYREVLMTQIALGMEVVGGVAANPDINIRKKPAEFIAEHRHIMFGGYGEEFVEVGKKLSDLMCELCENRTLALFNRALSNYGSHAHGALLTVERCRVYAEYLERLAVFIRDGQPDEARQMLREGLTVLINLVDVDTKDERVRDTRPAQPSESV